MAFYKISNPTDHRICVVMVGLPARGKTFISQKLVGYLSWLSIKAKCFTFADFRRKCGHLSPHAIEFNKNTGVINEGVESNDEDEDEEVIEEQALEQIRKWFQSENGVIAVLDDTNITSNRRRSIIEFCQKNNIQPIFVESWSEDEDFVQCNVKDMGRKSIEYKHMDPLEAKQKVMENINKFKKNYEPLDFEKDSDLTFVKLNSGSKEILINKIQTYLQSKIVFYILNLDLKPRCIWLSRHGESLYNLEQKIGGDSLLSKRGEKYSSKLPAIVKESAGLKEKDIVVWTSTLKRTQQTAQYLTNKKLQWRALDELDAGICDGMTYEEIEEKYPDDFQARDENKYEFRYRGGESYRDVALRLEPVIMELERQENILIITHQAVLRCIYAYYMNIPQEQSPWVSIPLHTLIKIEPRAYKTKVTTIKANIPAVSTYKVKGTSHVGEAEDVYTKPYGIIKDTSS